MGLGNFRGAEKVEFLRNIYASLREKTHRNWRPENEGVHAETKIIALPPRLKSRPRRIISKIRRSGKKMSKKGAPPDELLMKYAVGFRVQRRLSRFYTFFFPGAVVGPPI